MVQTQEGVVCEVDRLLIRSPSSQREPTGEDRVWVLKGGGCGEFHRRTQTREQQAAEVLVLESLIHFLR